MVTHWQNAAMLRPMGVIFDIISTLTWPIMKTRPRDKESAVHYLCRSFQVTGLYAWQDAAPIPADQRLGSDLSFADPDIADTFDRINDHLGTRFQEAHMDCTIEELAGLLFPEEAEDSVAD